MEVIQLSYPHELKREEQPPSSCAIGFFDGIHRGHQRVILSGKKIAEEKQITSAVMTFHPHPSVILNKKKKQIHYITPLDQKLEILKDLGIDRVYVVTFNKQLAILTPQQFVDHFIIGLNIKHLVSGFDFTYGKMGQGSAATIEEHARGAFRYTVIDKVTDRNQKISSTDIREQLKLGHMRVVHQLLGRPFRIKGRVVQGDQRGRTIGFPTANIRFSPDYLIPKIGVYAVKVYVRDQVYQGMANIGYKPTFNNNQKEPTLEVNMFEFNGNIYHETIIVDFYEYIRSEKKFAGIEELKKQLTEDQRKIKQFFLTSSR